MLNTSNNIYSFFVSSDWDGLRSRFDSMSNSEFRRAEQTIRQIVLPRLPNDLFWESYLNLIKIRRQAFLSSILAIHYLAHSGELSFRCDAATDAARWLHSNAPDAIVKVVRMALPQLVNSTQIMECLGWIDFYDYRELTSLLTHESTAHAYHALFLLLKHEADNTQLLRTACLNLLRKGDDMSFNMASILRSYFDISDINSTLSLKIEPYELSYIDQSYDNFLHVLNGKRPRL